MLKIIKNILLSLLILTLIGLFIFFTVRKSNDSFKNTILFVSDDNFYNLTYLRQKDDIDKILNENYARVIPLVYNIGALRYSDLRRDIVEACSSYSPTHIILSPTMLVYYLKNDESFDISYHSRGRAKILSISNVDRKGALDTVYSSPQNLDIWEDIAQLKLKNESEDIAFIYNSENTYSLSAYEAYRNKEDEDFIALDESPRESGDKEAEDLYKILFEDNSTSIIITPFFNNLVLLNEKIIENKKNVSFITDSELSFILNDNSIIAVSDTDLTEVFKKAFEDLSLNVRVENDIDTIKRKLIITKNYISRDEK